MQRGALLVMLADYVPRLSFSMAHPLASKHHWWPKGVSRYWKNDEGIVHWLKPDGEVISSDPANFAAIGGGHSVRLGNDPGEDTPWDFTFEPEFDRPDSAFPHVIEWLQSLDRPPLIEAGLRDRYIPIEAASEQIDQLLECVISLAVRSPMTRALAVATAEHLRGSIKVKEKNNLISMNLRGTQRNHARNIPYIGKVAIIYSPNREFIFGDGFYSTLAPGSYNLGSLSIICPITPRIAVVIHKPSQYRTRPRLSAITFADQETDGLNSVTQIYACNAVFYREEKPTPSEYFVLRRHQVLDWPNAICAFLRQLPGVQS